MRLYESVKMYELTEIIAHTVAYLTSAEQDTSISKEDLIESLRMRLAIIMGKIIAYPVTTNFALPYLERIVDQTTDSQILDEFLST